MECTPGEKPPEQTFDVDPTPSSSQYDWIVYINFSIVFFQRLLIKK